MNIKDLPCGINPPPLVFSHFPTLQQAVIWRNWEIIPVEKLALVLKTEKAEILELAEGMGLPVPPKVDSIWIEKSYITIIRSNWHLLPYEQLLQVLDWTPEYMAHILKEEDFLWHKLGHLKPNTTPVYYRPLTDDEKEKTLILKRTFLENFPDIYLKKREKPFAFARKFGKTKDSLLLKGNFNFIYSYSASYGDFLLHPELDPFPENLLKQYSSMGIKGIWFQVILYLLYPIDGAKEFSEGYETRIKNLKKLVEKAKKYGIDVYLYLNEPRGMSDKFYLKHPEWKGIETEDKGIFTNCTTRSKSPLKWLENASHHVFKKIPDIAGAFLISMSENATHCHSRWKGDHCDYCKKRSLPEIIAEIVKAVERGIHRASPRAKVIVWNWGWSSDWEHDVLELLPKKTYLMCVSEKGKVINIGGIKGEIGDYSISQVGPSKRIAKLWAHAKKLGLRTVAKVQLNNSWECPAVPYMPVSYLVKEHLDKLQKNSIDGIMLSWTLGGYPGGNLELLTGTPEEIALKKFGEKAAPLVCNAWKKFSNAFREFPFHVKVLYFAPMAYGSQNLLYPKKTGYKASMIGFPYDDLETWRAIYPELIFEKQFQNLTEHWHEGLKILEDARKRMPAKSLDDFTDLKNVAIAAYCHLRSTYLQIRFIRLRDKGLKEGLLQILNEEIKLAKIMHDIVMRDSRIGFEASNHYFYTLNDLREKVLNCEYLKLYL
ncbi:MAG: hypothetical protein UT30_C0021G0005 [Candidatus Uhrbacteria bacterium GW2011_GWF2_39_13]|uniref:Uncharacterized protein n=1 Tax=Candidatus Uhrbacteria bacterium GW2011_GWF2_39_13 TaxID=1618995 RepID=A0A0G0MTG8_9BACT|nr:MAG: hypothetical protein UT30_C0021G0005 [Candidatus Uhrbacteria bacterium GW2011_GWF2_39_13]